MSPTRRINTRGVFIQRVGYRKNDPHRKMTPIYYCGASKAERHLGRQRSRAALRDHFSRRLSVRLSHFWFAYNFFTLRDRTFIFGMCVSYDKTFPMVPYILSTWPWPWPLTYIWKTLPLHITFLPLHIVLSYWTDVFLMTRPFRWYYTFWARDLDRDLWPTFEKL